MRLFTAIYTLFCILMSLQLFAFESLAKDEATQAELATVQLADSQLHQLVFENFKTGHDFCQDFVATTGLEKGKWISVPKDYRHPELGTIQLYYWLNDSFDPQKPSYIYFDGGPGGNSHEKWGLPDVGYNVIFFDQRGIGCSHPDKIADYLNPDIFSSEKTARDADLIRQDLGIDKISAYGISYGTIPSTIFASLFPEHVTALVLDGIEYSSADNANMNINVYELKKIFFSLPLETQKKMLVYFNTPSKARRLYHKGISKTYLPSAYDQIKKTLLEIFPENGITDVVKADALFANYTSAEKVQRVGNFEEYIFPLFECKEMPMDYVDATFDLARGTAALPFFLNPELRIVDWLCQGIPGAQKPEPYIATNYPVVVPVTYFQGTWDEPTPPSGAIKHYKKVPQKFKQMLIAKHGGHAPNYVELSVGNKNEIAIQIEIFKNALQGNIISKASLIKGADSSGVQWILVPQKVSH